MIKIEKTDIHGWEAAIRGARNSFNSWDKSDSYENYPYYRVGAADLDLMRKLAKAGPSHAKYRRFITVTMDVTGPLYWWKEMDTYKVGTVGNSCSTMHKIADKEFELEDFSCEHLSIFREHSMYVPNEYHFSSKDLLDLEIQVLNQCREKYIKSKKRDKNYWWQMIQLLPSSYNQKRTLLVNYEVLANIYHQRKEHKLDEWQTFCEWIKGLPISEIITGEETDIDSETVEKLVDCGNVYPISPEECRDLMKGDSND